MQHVRRSDGTTDTLYLPGDHLGSVDAVLDASANVLVRTSFDAWGGRRDDDWVGTPSTSEFQQIANTTRHGFGGQEMLDNVGLVHMNGRVYEPATGRMLSADPFVVPMLGSQGFNRYAYVGNQPLTYVDPSGFNPIDPNDPDDGWDFDICFGFCGGIYIGDRFVNPNGPRDCPGWCVPDGDPRNNPGTGGREEVELFISSRTGDHVNVSTAGGNGTWGDFGFGVLRGAFDDAARMIIVSGAAMRIMQGDFLNPHNYHALRHGWSAQILGAPDSNRGQFGYDLGPALTVVAGSGIGTIATTGAKSVYQMALGLARHGESGAATLLANFARRVGARTYGDIFGSWWPGSMEALQGNILAAMKGADRLHFNLDQFNLGTFRNFMKNPSFSAQNITNWELGTILRDPALLKKAIFYGPDGVVVPAPGL